MPGHVPFEAGNQYARLGGLAKRANGTIAKAREWIRQNGVERAIEWIDGDDSAKARFALGLLFTYALGKPKETVEVMNTVEILSRFRDDPRLEAITNGYAAYVESRRRIGAEDALLGNGQPPIQTSSAIEDSL